MNMIRSQRTTCGLQVRKALDRGRKRKAPIVDGGRRLDNICVRYRDVSLSFSADLTTLRSPAMLHGSAGKAGCAELWLAPLQALVVLLGLLRRYHVVAREKSCLGEVSEILKDLSGEVFLRFPRRPFSKKKKFLRDFQSFSEIFPAGSRNACQRVSKMCLANRFV